MNANEILKMSIQNVREMYSNSILIYGMLTHNYQSLI